MVIQGLSPLQSWLERIDGYLTKNEIMKARFAAFVLPIFEGMEFLTLMRKICFSSSLDLEVPRSHLMIKASFTAFNILFSGFYGFKDPKGNIQYHKQCDLFPREKDVIDEIREDIDKPEEEEDYELPPLHKKEEAPPQIEEVLRDSDVQLYAKPRFSPFDSKSSSPSSHHKESSPENEAVQKRITKLKNTPRFLTRKASFRETTKALAKCFNNKKFGSVPVRKRSHSKLPIFINDKRAHVQKLRASAPSLLAIFEEEVKNTKVVPMVKSTPNLIGQFQNNLHGRINLEELKNLDELNDDVLEMHAEEANFQKSQIPPLAAPEELEPIIEFIKHTMSNTGSWSAKDQKIHLKKSNDFIVAPAVINVLSQAHDKGLFLKLTIEQAHNLNYNLTVLDTHFETIRRGQMDSFFAMSQTIQSHLTKLLVQEDFNTGRLYTSCLKLFSHIMQLLKKPIVEENNLHQMEQKRLFEQPISSNICMLIDNWKYAELVNSKKAKKPLEKFSIHDYYSILQAYLQNHPNVMDQQWSHLQKAKSGKEWYQAFLQLQVEDQSLIVGILKMLRLAHQKMWQKDLQNMLQATHSVTALIFPIEKVRINDQVIDGENLDLAIFNAILSEFKEI